MVKDLRPPAGGEQKSKIAEIWKRNSEIILNYLLTKKDP